MKNAYCKRFCFFLALSLLACLISACTPKLDLEEKTGEPAVTRETKSEEKTSVEPMETVTTEETKEDVPDPAEDGVLRVLMIGNSFCYYFPDELCGLAASAGIPIQVCNVYYSGCTLKQHWEWLQNGESNYSFFIHDENGSVKKSTYNLRRCLAAENWDVITIQQHFGTQTAVSYEKCINSCLPYGQNLLNFLKSECPKAKIYFQQTWAYQVGYNGGGGPVPDTATQTAHHENIRRACLEFCAETGLDRIPSGDAWALARKNPVIGDTLCNKGPGGDATLGDFYHDGTTGGGQYLNACVWFEVLTGRSCVGNAFRPTDYTLDEAKATALQSIAHQAVLAL